MVLESGPAACDNLSPLNLLEARRAFRDLPVAHLATTRADGSPHVVPLWFVWREEAIYVSCRRDSATWRNVEHDRRVAVSVERGRRWREYAGVTIHGRAEPLSTEHPALRGVLSQWFEKYRRLLNEGGFQDYAQQVEEPGMLLVRPERISAWDHGVGLRSARTAGG